MTEPASDVTLYAWAAVTTYFTGYTFQHAFVTSYPLSTAYKTFADLPDGHEFWYCWGDYYDSADGGVNKNPDGAIGHTQADLATVRAMVTPGVGPPKLGHGSAADTQNGTIRFYAIDGVCHQVANQALFSSGSATEEPMRVSQIGSYPFSTFFFTNYGLNDLGWEAVRTKHAPDVKVPGDDFEAWYTKVLPDAGTLEKDAVAAIRGVAHASLRGLAELKVPYPVKSALVKGTFLVAFEGLKIALGKERFGRLFPAFAKKAPTTPDEAAHWVDPKRIAQPTNEAPAQ